MAKPRHHRQQDRAAALPRVHGRAGRRRARCGHAARQLAPGGDGWFRRRGLRVPRFVHPLARHARSADDPRACAGKRRQPHRPAGRHRHRHGRAADRHHRRGRRPHAAAIYQGADHRDAGARLAVRNTVYALHYAHLVYMHPDAGCVGLRFPRTTHPVYWDFVYFAFTCGMAFATSDVEVTETHMRKIVTDSLPGGLRLQHRRARLHHQPARRRAKRQRRSPAEQRSCAARRSGIPRRSGPLRRGCRPIRAHETPASQARTPRGRRCIR